MANQGRHTMSRLLGLLMILTTLTVSALGFVPSCRVITQMIMPCLPYLSDRALVPYGSCCGGIAMLNRTATTYQDRVGICNCLKGISPRLPLVDFSRAAALPRTCGVNLNVSTISPSTNCYSLSSSSSP